MVKFIYRSSENYDKNNHWNICEKSKIPYIELTRIDKFNVNIFYDITYLKVDLEIVSEELRQLYRSYLVFFGYDIMMNEINQNDHYFFNFIVHVKHAEYIANHLYDYLLSKI